MEPTDLHRPGKNASVELTGNYIPLISAAQRNWLEELQNYKSRVLKTEFTSESLTPAQSLHTPLPRAANEASSLYKALLRKLAPVPPKKGTALNSRSVPPTNEFSLQLSRHAGWWHLLQ